ncbi:MAG TPA: pitrilysin family protein [Candidatus Dormibacteraeota bacterium]|nr:pitrilysin family protein [Candidatus Dormibacteraeota bacterium]
MHKVKFALAIPVALGLLIGLPGTQWATQDQAAKQTAKTASRSLQIPIQQITLKNGLRVILSEDHAAPTYSIAVNYNVGSRDERQGRTGFAHLFEHMMYQGSENVGKGEHFILIENNGGGMNGTTNADRTIYFETLPANQLDLGLYLEADRMKSLAITQGNLDNQRNAVQEERRLGVDNQPYGKTFETIVDTAYDNFGYKHSTIGSMKDLDAATVQDVSEFFRIYYAPNNAVLALVGDFKSEEAIAKIKKYFETIPPQATPPVPDMSEPAQTAERRKTIQDTFAQLPRVDIEYKIPPGNTADWYAMAVLMEILGRGQSSRLYQKLVKDKEVAAQTVAFAQERRGPSLASTIALVRPGKDTAEAEKLVYEEIERLQKEPVADWELEKVRMLDRHDRASQLQGTLFRAIQLAQYATAYNDPGLINTVGEKIRSITKADIQRVAQTYMKPTNRTVVLTTPTPRGAPGGQPGAAGKER